MYFIVLRYSKDSISYFTCRVFSYLCWYLCCTEHWWKLYETAIHLLYVLLLMITIFLFTQMFLINLYSTA